MESLGSNPPPRVVKAVWVCSMKSPSQGADSHPAHDSNLATYPKSLQQSTRRRPCNPILRMLTNRKFYFAKYPQKKKKETLSKENSFESWRCSIVSKDLVAAHLSRQNSAVASNRRLALYPLGEGLDMLFI